MTDQNQTPADPPPPEITFGDVFRAGWKKLKEMRTVFQLLVVIAIAALICAIVPQNADPQSYAMRYGQLLGSLIVNLGLNHVHSTGWFELLLAILLLSLMACSGRLWKEAGMRWRIPSAAAAAQKLRGAGKLSGLAAGTVEEAESRARPVLRKHGYHLLNLQSDGDTRLLYVHKHRFSAWGQALAHYSVFLIALGSVMGAMHGLSLDQNVTIQEGSTFHTDDGSLPFGIKVVRFSIDRDSNNDSVKNYYSEVKLVSGDQTVLSGTISVNHPLRYQGYFISQSDWSLGEAKIEVTRDGKTEPYSFPLERAACPGMGDDDASTWAVPKDAAVLFLPEDHAAVVATNFYADALRHDGKVTQRNSEYPGTPALSLEYVGGIPGVKPKGAATGPPKHSMKDLGWLLPGETTSVGDVQVKFVGITKATGLGIRKDVGLPLVWIGFIASILGLMMIFYFPVQRSVVSFQPGEQGGTTLTLAAYGRAGDLADDSSDVWKDLLAALGGEAVTNSAADQKENSRD